jgi:type II secretory ATPase GspE/PulE/Tfp pilus assembly ATPase PilB-like protein
VDAFQGGGCEVCNGSGYKGRAGIFELMQLNEELRELIMKGADASKLTDAARRNGMRQLREDGWDKVKRGMTTAEEVTRVTQEF